MKKFFSLLMTLFTAVAAFAQASNITGTADKVFIENVSLYKVLNGRLQEVATSRPDAEGRFAFRFTPEYEGFYVVGIGSPLTGMNKYKFYFKGNEELTIKLGRNSCELISSNSPENKALDKWNKASAEIALKSTSPGTQSTYVDFFPQVESLYQQLPALKKGVKTGNKVFDAKFPTLVDYDFAYYAISYNLMPRSAHPDADEMSPYYQQFNADQFMTEELLNLPYGDRFLNNLVINKNMGKSGFPKEDVVVASIPSDKLKGQYVVAKMERIRSMEELLVAKDMYQKYITLPEQIERVAAVEAKLAQTKGGAPAVNFAYNDINGKTTSLKDLRGKVVLVDMWATWCGPCRAEEPYWEKLNEEYKGKDVAFVGVSVDQEKDKWEEYVKTKALKGIQLHAGPDNMLSTAYKVTGIPRYILIDKQGNIIAADSPRPSNPKLKELINSWLSK